MDIKIDGLNDENLTKILIVDDHMFLSEGIALALMKNKPNCMPLLAHSIADALTILNDNNLIYWLWDVRPDILAFCTNWLNQDSPIDSYWKLRTPYWSGWFIGANRCGEERGTPFRGESAIISPEKRTVAQAQISEDGVLFWDTESAELEP